MANSPQSAKRARQAERRRLRGQSLRSQFRTAAKKTRAAAQTGESETARKNFQAFQTIADRLADRGVVHHNTVSRLKSRINADLKKAQERAAHSAQAADAVDAGAAKAKAAGRKAKTAPAGLSAQKDEAKTVKAADKPEQVEAKADDAPESESGMDSKPAEAAGGEVKADSPDSPPAKAETDDGEGEKAQKAG